MASKIRIGIIFGGQSREREISFAGGRTVYDNLNKSVFEAVPVFVDSFGNLVELNWEFIYKGSIRDFYPPAEFLPSDSPFQLYAENLGPLDRNHQLELVKPLGQIMTVESLKERIDFAFLCLHGPFGEDGRIQGLLEFHGIPYSGSGVLASAIGIDKAVQKELMVAKKFNSPPYLAIKRRDWIDGKATNAFRDVSEKIGFPCVVKPAHQGSSIGVSILKEADEQMFMAAVEKALFTRWVDAATWMAMGSEEKAGYVKTLADIREGVGLPVIVTHPPEFRGRVFYNPSELEVFFNGHLTKDGIVLESLDSEGVVLVEGFIEGKEFSCIVIDNEGKGVALPPTEIRKGKELFDYRSKYLPGLSRKITPIDLEEGKINEIRDTCERLFAELHFDVYARIDGFMGGDGKVYLNDPNTTSGMMPSSFFFHQAAEIGLNPSQFLSFIIRASLLRITDDHPGSLHYQNLLRRLDEQIRDDREGAKHKTRVAVILGGYSSERHISVESGRNVYEKLASSEKYAPFAVFLTGSNVAYDLYQIPVNLLLKDNADDIAEKIEHFKVHPVVRDIVARCSEITKMFAGDHTLIPPQRIGFDELAKRCDEVFIALHGRPGEDGQIQQQLDRAGLPYNGSSSESSSLTIDKFRTNEILKSNGFLVAGHLLVTRSEWQSKKDEVRKKLETLNYPLIAKPVDDGCSSAVKKIRSFGEFEAFCRLMFRDNEGLDEKASALLQIKPKEEFPRKQVILVEELISRNGAAHFLEITGGMLSHFGKDGTMTYEVFEASESLADSDILSLEEKFLAGQGQNITPARYSNDPAERQRISDEVKGAFGDAAKVLGVSGYCRIDAFVRVYTGGKVEVIFIEVNSLPGMTPATCIFHQAAISHYRPYEFIDSILDFGKKRLEMVN